MRYECPLWVKSRHVQCTSRCPLARSGRGVPLFGRLIHFERRVSTLLISAHQPAVAGNIGREDGGQTPFDVRLGHRVAPDFEPSLWSGGVRVYRATCPLWVKSRHVQRTSRCPLSANSGHRAIHSITSSARPISALGTLRPSVLAVLRFMISSTLVACCTGRSAGLSPLRTWPV